MDIAEGELADVEEKVFQILENFQGTNTFHDQFADFITGIQSEIENFKKFGEFKIDPSHIKKERLTAIDENAGSKENGKNYSKIEEEPIRRSTRTKVLSEISTNTTQSRDEKPERDHDDAPIVAAVVVKSEMPPPQQPVRRGRKKKVVPKVSTGNDDTGDYSRDSDVVLQKDHISIIQLSDSDEDEKPAPIPRQSKKNQQVPKENVKSASQDESQRRGTRTKNIEAPVETTTRSTRTKTRATPQETIHAERDKSTDSQSTEEESASTSSKAASASATNKSKTKKTKPTKRSRSRSSEDERQLNSKLKRSKSLEEQQKAKVADQTYVKLNETTARTADETVVIEKPANDTIVLSKAGNIIVTTPLNRRVDLNDLLTDDEDEKVIEKSPVKPGGSKKPGRPPASKVKNGPTKPVFSSYENSPVKMRVEAFEKLKANVAADEPPRMTRTKTKAKQTKEQQEEESKESLESQLPSKLPVKDKSKVTPQHQNRFLPATFGSSSSASKACKTGLKDIVMPARSASALKACQQEFVERELKRQKEEEAVRKRDALLQAKKEESRRKREEKQLKAQSTRAALEKDKQKMLEDAERAKEEKYRQMMAEKNEKLQRQREEAEARRLLATKKALEERRREERRAMEKARRDEPKPIYMDQSAPLLPTADCYDSDDSTDRKGNAYVKPQWTRRVNQVPVLKDIHHAGEKVKNTLFMCQATTPDLQEIFQRINPNKLKRTSSAVWRKPPRFTIMPIRNESIAEDSDY